MRKRLAGHPDGKSSIRSGGPRITPRQVVRFLLATLGFTILGVVLFVGFSNYFLNQRVQGEVQKIRRMAREYPALNYYPEMTRGLPSPLQRYFRFVFRDSLPKRNLVEIYIRGHRETGSQKIWALEGKIYCLTTRPVWVSSLILKTHPLWWMRSQQRYWLGEGGEWTKLFASIGAEDVVRLNENQAFLQQYLALTPLFPLALLPGPFLRWETVDSSVCRVFLRDENLEVRALVHFDSGGKITQMTAETSREAPDRSAKPEWAVYYCRYRLFNGHRVPTELEIVRRLPRGEFVRTRYQVDRIQYGLVGR